MGNQEARKTVGIFGAASFLNDLGSDMIFPVWPFFVTMALHANMAALGFLDGLGEAMVALSQAGAGYWSDRIRKRKVFIWLGYFLAFVARTGYALSAYWPQLIPFRLCDRLGKMRGAPRDAILADVTERADRGKAFGILRMMDNLGAVCGIVLCVALVSVLGYRKLFLLAAVPSVISALLVLTFIREKAPALDRAPRPPFTARRLDGNFQLFLLASAVLALATFSYSFLLIYANRVGFPVFVVPLLYLVFTFTASVCSLPLGKLADRIGRKPVLVLSFLLWGAVCAAFLIGKNPWVIVGAFILYGIHKGGLDTVQRAFVAELAPAEYRASGLGVFQMAVGLCALPSSFLAGIFWIGFNQSAPLYISIGLTAVATGLLVFVREM